MDKEKILNLIEKNIPKENLEKAKKILKNEYEISYGNYYPEELKKSIDDKSPFFIQNDFIIGYEPTGEFLNDRKEKIKIDKMIKAIIIEDEIEGAEVIEKTDSRDYFSIVDRIEGWDQKYIDDFNAIFGGLRVGEIYLPQHSVVFNFLKPSQKQIEDKIVSMLSGVNIHIYNTDNFIDNAIHEVGHVFWRDCLKNDERQQFYELWKSSKPSSIYEYHWERKDAEEMFCTIYKYFLKSILLNPSFCNILEFEEPRGTEYLRKIFERITKNKLAEDLWELGKQNVFNYFNAKLDLTTGKKIVKKGTLDVIKDLNLPESVTNDISKVRDNVIFVKLDKALEVPVQGDKIFFGYSQALKKAKDKKKYTVYVDMDGVVADFVKGYKNAFDRNAYKDDMFTVNQFCTKMPNFFATLPVIEKGLDLVNRLNKRYNIVFLTTPMEGMPECKIDKYNWLKNNIGDYDIIFSNNKQDYVVDDFSVLIDDMDYNLEPWEAAGGTAINSKLKNDKIIDIIDELFYFTEDYIKDMEVNTDPSQLQKESGKYKKGKIIFKGLDIRIENPKGSVRWGFGEDGKKWITVMKNHYGYITGCEGNDYDPIDCFVGDKLNASRAFVVNQQTPDKMFDEHKIMLGFDNMEEASKAYLSNYQKGWDGIQSIVQTNTKKLRDWFKNGSPKEPFKNLS